MNTTYRWNNSVNRSPCLDCANRKAGCHASCTGYKAWKAEIDTANETIRKKRMDTELATEQTIHHIEKQKKLR